MKPLFVVKVFLDENKHIGYVSKSWTITTDIEEYLIRDTKKSASQVARIFINHFDSETNITTKIAKWNIKETLL